MTLLKLGLLKINMHWKAPPLSNKTEKKITPLCILKFILLLYYFVVNMKHSCISLRHQNQNYFLFFIYTYIIAC